MGELTHKATRAAFGKAIELTLKHVEKDREKGLLQLVDLTEKFMGDNFPSESYEGARNLIRDPESKWMQYVNRALDEIHPNVIKQTALNLGFEAAFHGTKTIRAMRETHQCNIPWLILMDPTSACNLHCTGCWAAEYGHKLNLSYEDLDRIITQGKELGIYFYMYTGGEPLVRKADIIKLCEKHYDCEFHAFTNGTLVDDAFCEEMQRVGNLSLSISLEGFEEVNDLRRGVGVYDKVMAAMDKLKSHGLIFGTSICYTSKNIETVTSDEFLDMIIEKGCRFTWYFHYMPVGNEAAVDLLPTKEQRKYMYHRVREIRGATGGKPIYAMDFQNDGEFVGGCIAGGRNYCHINANGDVEPCVFIHYSSANIKEVSLLEALKQPLFMAYRDHQPFNNNHLRPCPMLENPEILQEMADAGVGSVMLFGIPDHKDEVGSGAYDPNGIVQKALREAKKQFPDMYYITDVCMCEYTSHGHCGVLCGHDVDNDATLELLAKTAVSHIEAGADMVAPSDMMDGRVRAIREALDANGHYEAPIMSYAVKYASAFYGPFRDAAGSAPSFGDRKSYQMDFHNRREGMKEALTDVEEGADIIMVKPAMSYLDMVSEVSKAVNVPVAAYSVSGEYAMVKAAAKMDWIDEERIMCEMAVSAYRAGAQIYLTYYAKELAKCMDEGRIG